MPNEKTDDERLAELVDEIVELRQLKRNFDKVYEVLKSDNSPLRDLLDLIRYGDNFKELREKDE